MTAQPASTLSTIATARHRGAYWYPSRCNSDGTPVRWPAEQTISWALNRLWPVDEQAQALVSKAITMIAAASGLRFSQVADIDIDPDEEVRHLVVGVRFVISLPQQRADNTVAGTACPRSVASGHGRRHYDTADVRAYAGDGAPPLGVLLHELGHAVGLAHVRSRAEVMHPHYVGLDTLGEGDRLGLRALGALGYLVHPPRSAR